MLHFEPLVYIIAKRDDIYIYIYEFNDHVIYLHWYTGEEVGGIDN